MPKTKISEYSATANSNTDVASINIDEGCAPSGINNAIRAVMGHLKDFQTGTSSDPLTVGGALTTSSTVTHNGGTANGVAYLNGSKVLTTGSALTFDGTNFGVGAGSALTNITINGNASGGFIRGQRAGANQWFVGDTASALGSGTGLINFVYNNDPFIWYNGNLSAEQMRLTSTGLGIGTSSPTAKLDVLDANKAINSYGNIFIHTTTDQAADVGAQLCLGGVGVTGGASNGVFGAVAGRKENSTSSNYAGYLQFSTSTSGSTVTERARIDSSGNLIQTVNTTAATLTTNQTLTFSIVNNSLLRISVRGSDGTTRTATLALA